MSFQFKLEPYNGRKSRYFCPKCRKKEFVRYINSETLEHIHPNVGRCNKQLKCAYHLTPKEYFSGQPQKPGLIINNLITLPKSPTYIPIDIFKASLHVDKSVNEIACSNEFIKSLLKIFGSEITSKKIKQYFIGTSSYWPGATIFWQIDVVGRVRTGKIILYDDKCKRVKRPFSHIHWAHKLINVPQFELQQCLFGEHLITSDPKKPIAIVESEKTAVISSIYFPNFIWLATGGSENFNLIKKCQELKGREVILFPDLKYFSLWNSKAKECVNFKHLSVSDFLEKNSTDDEKSKGLDLADYLLKFPLEYFLNKNQVGTNIRKEIKPGEKEFISLVERRPELFSKKNVSEWGKEIHEIENYFCEIELPSHPIKFNSCSTISCVKTFIDCHLQTVKANNGKKIYRPYLERLQQLKLILQQTLE